MVCGRGERTCNLRNEQGFIMGCGEVKKGAGSSRSLDLFTLRLNPFPGGNSPGISLPLDCPSREGSLQCCGGAYHKLLQPGSCSPSCAGRNERGIWIHICLPKRHFAAFMFSLFWWQYRIKLQWITTLKRRSETSWLQPEILGGQRSLPHILSVLFIPSFRIYAC